VIIVKFYQPTVPPATPPNFYLISQYIKIIK
jgi:hypothetical protein